jgi:hypothetical protein
MLKNIYLLTTLIGLSFASTIASTHQISAIKHKLVHIAQVKKDIIAEKHITNSRSKNIKKHIQRESISHWVEYHHYKELSKTIKTSVNTITTLNEFTSMIDQITDAQIASIVDKQMNYYDIAYTIEAYSARPKPLKQAIDSTIESESIKSHTYGTLFFNLHYFKTTQHLGYELLLKKLNRKEQDLKAELAALEAIHAWPIKLFIDKLKSILLL